MDTSKLWHEFKSTGDSFLKKKIMLQYTNLVHYVIHNKKFFDIDILDSRDFFQFGIEGLSEAVDRFDPDYGTKFETYAIQRIRGKIIDELRKIQPAPKNNKNGQDGELKYCTISIYQTNDEEGGTLADIIPGEDDDPYQSAEKSEAKELLVKAIKELDEKKRLVITLYYFENLNYEEIAKVLNITVSRVSQIHSRVIILLREKLSVLISD